MSDTITVNGKQYRRLTSAEARAATYRQQIQFVGIQQDVKRVFVSGACKTWKREPSRFRLPVKFGLYESSALVEDHTNPELAAFEGCSGSYPMPVVEVA